MPAPIPTPIYRIVHRDNLAGFCQCGLLHSHNHAPAEVQYHAIHDEDVQANRHARNVPCGPGGTVHDYVPFYFGYRSPMLLRLHTGRVQGYTEGQQPIVYLVSTAQAVAEAQQQFVFTDGHGLARYTRWFDSLDNLNEVPWDTVYARQWNDTVDHPDRQRRKQAEFLVHTTCPWNLLIEIGVLSEAMRQWVAGVLAAHPQAHQPAIHIRREWYY
ncbi:MAG: DUF4433 domain-containing protein [Thermodesulfobacteriota bacterium]